MEKELTEIHELLTVNVTLAIAKRPTDKRQTKVMLDEVQQKLLAESVEIGMLCTYQLMNFTNGNSILGKLIETLDQLISYRLDSDASKMVFVREVRRLEKKSDPQSKKGKFTEEDRANLLAHKKLQQSRYNLCDVDNKNKKHIYQLLVDLDDYILHAKSFTGQRQSYRFYLLHLFMAVQTIEFWHKSLDPNRKFQAFRKSLQK